MDEELISVIVPVYNVEKYLDKCVQSIVEQSYTNLEIILIDDGSTDASGLICDDWEAKDSRISVIHKSNGGLSDARNAGIKASRGNYIVFVDSDDTVHPEYVDYLYRILVDNEADIAICEIRIVTEKEKEINHFSNNGEVIWMGQERALYEMCAEKMYSCSACAKIYSRSAFHDICFPVGRLFEDLGTTYRVFLDARKIVFGKRALYNYYRREGSIMTSNFTYKRMDAVYFAEEMCRDIVSVWPDLSQIAAERLFREYVSTLLSIVSLGKNFREYAYEFNSIFRKLSVVRRTISGERFPPRMRIYYYLSYFGKRLLYFVMMVEEFVYRNLQMKF